MDVGFLPTVICMMYTIPMIFMAMKEWLEMRCKCTMVVYTEFDDGSNVVDDDDEVNCDFCGYDVVVVVDIDVSSRQHGVIGDIVSRT
jgi:hypothetical protein